MNKFEAFKEEEELELYIYYTYIGFSLIDVNEMKDKMANHLQSVTHSMLFYRPAQYVFDCVSLDASVI